MGRSGWWSLLLRRRAAGRRGDGPPAAAAATDRLPPPGSAAQGPNPPTGPGLIMPSVLQWRDWHTPPARVVPRVFFLFSGCFSLRLTAALPDRVASRRCGFKPARRIGGEGWLSRKAWNAPAAEICGAALESSAANSGVPGLVT